MDPIHSGREFWRKNIKPLFVTERRETNFGVHYNKMNAIKETLSPLEQQRLHFYIAATSEEEPIRDYIQYINRMAQFCEQCVRHPESALAKDIDGGRLMKFKTAVDMTVNALRNSDKAYLDRIRHEMGTPPVNDDMAKRVRRTEIAMLKEDILQSPRQP